MLTINKYKNHRAFQQLCRDVGSRKIVGLKTVLLHSYLIFLPIELHSPRVLACPKYLMAMLTITIV